MLSNQTKIFNINVNVIFWANLRSHIIDVWLLTWRGGAENTPGGAWRGRNQEKVENHCRRVWGMTTETGSHNKHPNTLATFCNWTHTAVVTTMVISHLFYICHVSVENRVWLFLLTLLNILDNVNYVHVAFGPVHGALNNVNVTTFDLKYALINADINKLMLIYHRNSIHCLFIYIT